MQSTRDDFDANFKKQIKDFLILRNPSKSQWQAFITAFVKLEMPAALKLEKVQQIIKDVEYGHKRFTTLYFALIRAELLNESIDWSLLTTWLPIILKDSAALDAQELLIIDQILNLITSFTELNYFISGMLPSIIELTDDAEDKALTTALLKKMLHLKLTSTELFQICQNQSVNYLLSKHANEEQVRRVLDAVGKVFKDDAAANEIMELFLMGSEEGSLIHRALSYETTALLFFELLEKLEKHVSETQLINLLMLSFSYNPKKAVTTALYPFILVAMFSHSDRFNLDKAFVRLSEKYLIKVLNSNQSITLLTSFNFLQMEKPPTYWPDSARNLRSDFLNKNLILRYFRNKSFTAWFKQALETENPELTRIIDECICFEQIDNNNNVMGNVFSLIEACLANEKYKQQVVSSISNQREDLIYNFLTRCFMHTDISIERSLEVATTLLPKETFQTKVLTRWLHAYQHPPTSGTWRAPWSATETLEHGLRHNEHRFAKGLIFLYQKEIGTQAIRLFLKTPIQYFPNNFSVFMTFCEHLSTCKRESIIYELINHGMVEPNFKGKRGHIKEVMLLDYTCQRSPEEKKPILESIRDRSSPFGDWYWEKTDFLCSHKVSLPKRFGAIVRMELQALEEAPSSTPESSPRM